MGISWGWGVAVGLLGMVVPGVSMAAEILPFSGEEPGIEQRTDAWVAPMLNRLQTNYACTLAKGPSLASQSSRNRYALAAMFDACLRQIESKRLKQQDRAVVQRLQTELAPELAILKTDQITLAVDPGSEALARGIESDARLTEVAYEQGFELPVSQTPVRLQYVRGKGVSQAATLGVNVEATVGTLGFFGEYNLSERPAPDTLPAVTQEHSDRSWVAGVGLQNFILPQAVLAVTAGQPLQTDDLEVRPTNFAAFYRLPLTQTLTITPTITVIREPLNPTNRPTVEGAIKATFSF